VVEFGPRVTREKEVPSFLHCPNLQSVNFLFL
jgi:hypothetical protein